MSDTTRDLKIPLDEALLVLAHDIRMVSERLKHYTGAMPDGQVRVALSRVIVRLVAQIDVLHEQATEIDTNWPAKEVDR